MASSSSLRYERSQYYDLRSNIERGIGKLNESLSTLNDANLKLEEGFSVNSVTNDNGAFLKSVNKLSGTRDYLNNVIVDRINDKISHLTRSIEIAEAREAQEAREAEEARLRAMDSSW